MQWQDIKHCAMDIATYRVNWPNCKFSKIKNTAFFLQYKMRLELGEGWYATNV